MLAADQVTLDQATAKLTTCVEIPPAADDLACDTRQFTMTFKREDGTISLQSFVKTKHVQWF